MLYVKADGLLQVALPPPVRLARQAVDKVDADVPETGLAEAVYGCDGLCGIVPAVQQLQCRVVECLYAHADAVEGECAQHGHVFFRQVVGIGLECDFSGISRSIGFFDGLEYLPEVFGGELRGSSAAEVDGFYRFSFQIVLAGFQFGAQGTDIWLFQFATGGRIEIAIDAACLAKRNMNIDACHGMLMDICCKNSLLAGEYTGFGDI